MMCVVEVVTGDGFVCEDVLTLSGSLIISGVQIDVGFLNDLIQDYIETRLVRANWCTAVINSYQYS